MIPVLQTGIKIHRENNVAKTYAVLLDLCILLLDTMLSEQQSCEEALGVLNASIILYKQTSNNQCYNAGAMSVSQTCINA